MQNRGRKERGVTGGGHALVTSSVDFLLAESAIEEEAGEDENYSQPLAPKQAVPEEDD
jgi:hypothetical protein